jgi:hypothetical protein
LTKYLIIKSVYVRCASIVAEKHSPRKLTSFSNVAVQNSPTSADEATVEMSLPTGGETETLPPV